MNKQPSAIDLNNAMPIEAQQAGLHFEVHSDYEGSPIDYRLRDRNNEVVMEFTKPPLSLVEMDELCKQAMEVKRG